MDKVEKLTKRSVDELTDEDFKILDHCASALLSFSALGAAGKAMKGGKMKKIFAHYDEDDMDEDYYRRRGGMRRLGHEHSRSWDRDDGDRRRSSWDDDRDERR